MPSSRDAEDEAMIDVFKLQVFGPADVFPMMSQDELEELAEDIAENGLREPLVTAEIDGVDSDGVVTKKLVLVDGRNRRVACKMAGVKVPAVRHLNGEDPTAYVLSANIHRRHMTKGQRAMAVAMIYPEPEKGGRGQKSLVPKEFSEARISQARTVLHELPLKAANVLAGSLPLDVAYKEALEERRKSNSREVRLDKLRAKYPDLADMVVEERLTIEGAEAEANQRDQIEENARALVFGFALDGFRKVCEFAKMKTQEDMARWLKDKKLSVALSRNFSDLGVPLDEDAFARGYKTLGIVINQLKKGQVDV